MFLPPRPAPALHSPFDAEAVASYIAGMGHDGLGVEPAAWGALRAALAATLREGKGGISGVKNNNTTRPQKRPRRPPFRALVEARWGPLMSPRGREGRPLLSPPDSHRSGGGDATEGREEEPTAAEKEFAAQSIVSCAALRAVARRGSSITVQDCRNEAASSTVQQQ